MKLFNLMRGCQLSQVSRMATITKLFNSSFNLISKQLTHPISNGINLTFFRALPHFVDIPKPGEKKNVFIKNCSKGLKNFFFILNRT